MDPHCTPPINLRTATTILHHEEILDYFPLLPDSSDSQLFPLLRDTANDATGCPVYINVLYICTSLGQQYRNPVQHKSL